MNIAKKILWCVVALVVVYGVVLVVERMTRQELTRVSHGQTGETACLMWQPRLLRGNGVVALDLLNAQGKKVDSTQVLVVDTGFNALQQCGQISFDDQGVTISNLKTGELVRRLAVKDGRLVKTD